MAPKTPLGYRRILSPTAGIRVSPLCLGGMSLGTKWADRTGEITKDEAFALLDAFYEAGGNFIDVANLYHDGESEEWVGEWMKLRGNRDKIVLATKYTGFNDGAEKDINSMGNHMKSMHLGVRESLKRLQTDYIDIFYYTTSVEEVMRGLHRHVLNGNILYPAISDTPAWIVAEANCFARANSLSPFVLYQGLWNLNVRDLEREVIPMLRKEGMGLAPWGVIGQGKWQSKAQIEERKKSGEKFRGSATELDEKDIKMGEALEEIASEVGNGATVTTVAIAWALLKTPYVFPILGGRKINHLEDNIKALTHDLTPAQIEKLEKIYPFDPGFPMNRFGGDSNITGKTENWLIKAAAEVQWVKAETAIRPTSE
ncbi:hypothetical protein IAR55_003205 [Kwoniella newhampshirensis]|uniref:NADP-dependent oxidoreductase domain-containing protein n=1 Tax=Kwoniella newhampshirensis TaxID=1651941 RepID=A0AAW0YY92_9TREE